MVRFSRTLVVLIPEALSVASLICLFLVFFAGNNTSYFRSLYYFQSNTTNFKQSSEGIQLNHLAHLWSGSPNISDFYNIYLWNYCSGDFVNGTQRVTYCSPRKAKFYFDPLEVWDLKGLNTSVTENILDKGITDAMNAYDKASVWLYIAYTISFWVTVGTVITGLFAICSRIGSCLTTFVSWAATLFTVLYAVTSTILFTTVVGALNTSLKKYNVTSSLGKTVLSLDWIAVAFSLAASLIWVITICCCSPHSSRKDRGYVASNVKPGFTPFSNVGTGYQPLPENYAYQQTSYPGPNVRGGGMEMQDMGVIGASTSPYKGRENAYEPFRHGGAV